LLEGVNADLLIEQILNEEEEDTAESETFDLPKPIPAR
jgi:hypothetical protein